MNISKTIFKEYSKCDLIFPLEEIYNKKINQNVNAYDDERMEKILEVLSSLYDENGEDLIVGDTTQIEAMLPFYQDVERVAIEIANKVFEKEFIFFEKTKDQKAYSFADENGHTYYCYLDGFYEDNDEAIVIEVKSISSSKLKRIGSKSKEHFYSIFKKENNIYSLIDINEWQLSKDKYQKNLEKLFNENDDFGKYVFDLAIERYIIENSINKNNLPRKKYKYYLGILNSDFYLDETGEYFRDDSSVINFVDLTDITYSWLEKIDKIRKNIVENISNNQLTKPKFNCSCGFSKSEKCKYFSVCWKEYLEKGSVLEYMGAKSFEDNEGKSLNLKYLVKNGYKKIEDIPYNWIKSKNHLIQRNCYDKNIEYIDKEKIKLGINQIKYPIYHLDFEAFNAPLPRFVGEKPFTQSVFQFSIHVEKNEKDCDFKKDNIAFVADDFTDQREKLVKEMIEAIDLSKGGTVLVYNKTFEYHRIEEFISYFPQYRKSLQKILDCMIDLEDIIHKGTKFYEKLGLEEKKLELINFYNNSQGGKYSIKKLLPVFSDLSYSGLDIYNGVVASASYAKFRYLEKEDIEEIIDNLKIYCGQDTWSMVLILQGLKEKIA